MTRRARATRHDYGVILFRLLCAALLALAVAAFAVAAMADTPDGRNALCGQEIGQCGGVWNG